MVNCIAMVARLYTEWLKKTIHKEKQEKNDTNFFMATTSKNIFTKQRWPLLLADKSRTLMVRHPPSISICFVLQWSAHVSRLQNFLLKSACDKHRSSQVEAYWSFLSIQAMLAAAELVTNAVNFGGIINTSRNTAVYHIKLGCKCY